MFVRFLSQNLVVDECNDITRNVRQFFMELVSYKVRICGLSWDLYCIEFREMCSTNLWFDIRRFQNILYIFCQASCFFVLFFFVLFYFHGERNEHRKRNSRFSNISLIRSPLGQKKIGLNTCVIMDRKIELTRKLVCNFVAFILRWS